MSLVTLNRNWGDVGEYFRMSADISSHLFYQVSLIGSSLSSPINVVHCNTAITQNFCCKGIF